MSRSNYDKPFYVDVGTSIVAIRCASNHDVLFRYDHARFPQSIKEANRTCDRLNEECEREIQKREDIMKVQGDLDDAFETLINARRDALGLAEKVNSLANDIAHAIDVIYRINKM